MVHGAGGSAMDALIKRYMLKYLGGSNAEVPLEALDDAAVINGIVLKSDSYAVKPLFFPGGDIGRLAVSGTVNDISALGAEPLALAAGFVFEEGFPLADLERILSSMSETCKEAGVAVITGDTKVVEHGALDKFIVNSSGIGRRSAFLDKNLAEVRKSRKFDAEWLLDSNIRAGDQIILSGAIGDHGIAVLSAREGYGFETKVQSDNAPLNHMIAEALKVGGVVSIKDPTRGGLANLLNEWSEKSKVGILIKDDKIPVHMGVRAACEMLGLDPLEVGNEGKVALAVVPEKTEQVLAALRNTNLGREAEIIGRATDEFDIVAVETSVGGKRILAKPLGDPVPRIC
ncbi:MAG TPA: hydrogenase expression/formation protein HypE [Candidatus Acidoferrum sp.]|nr:hydrogenase expression/formation protein HypE [Candidatus Acidoferrum sp.]